MSQVPSAQVRTQQVSIGRYTLEVRLGGPPAGRPVLLLHGFPVNGMCFDAVVPRLHRAGLRTIVPDQRGYSAAARPMDVAEYRMEHLVADATGLLDALEVERALLVGHDFGGMVGWHLASTRSERFIGYVPVSVGHPLAIRDALTGDQRGRSSYIRTFTAAAGESSILADGGAGLIASGCRTDEIEPLFAPEALTAALNWYRANFTGDIKGTMSCPPASIPVTMVYSDADPALGTEQAEGSAVHVTGRYRQRLISGVGHWIPQHAPAALSEEIIALAAVA